MPLLVKIAVKQLEIPPGVPVFERSLGKGLLPGRHWGVKISLVDTFANKVEKGELDPLLIQELEIEAQNWGPEKLLEEMEFHRKRAKQEEPRKIPRRVVIDRVCREGEEIKLTMEVRVRLTSGDEKILKVLIDTGAEANLIKEGVLPKNEFVRAEKGLFFVTANGRPMKGGRNIG